MKTLFKQAGLAVALGATALTVAAPAEAQRHRGHYRHRDDGGTAIVAGIAGLAIGAALASSSDRRYDYDRRYYRRHGYYPVDGRYYRDYYRPRYARGYYRDCYTRERWDPYLRERVIVRYCD